MTHDEKPRGAEDVGMETRLNDQLGNYLHAEKIKKNARLLNEIAFYPGHDKRKETDDYKAAHDLLVVKKDLPCLVCGVRSSTRNDPKENPYHARQMETHHHVVEWALANAIDVGRFNKIIRPHLAERHKDNEPAPSSWTPPIWWRLDPWNDGRGGSSPQSTRLRSSAWY
ncbi:MAG TPA: hypothetical protein VMK12_24660, partial [Anaeromyxobacteraceae bacterium]|nr:hypothetical protein [Anaeromyxobacteraceae bacterium]